MVPARAMVDLSHKPRADNRQVHVDSPDSPVSSRPGISVAWPWQKRRKALSRQSIPCSGVVLSCLQTSGTLAPLTAVASDSVFGQCFRVNRTTRTSKGVGLGSFRHGFTSSRKFIANDAFSSLTWACTGIMYPSLAHRWPGQPRESERAQ